MRIDVIDTLPAFARLEDNWNAVYDADPDAQLFMSWKWLSGWLQQIASPWLILAAKASDGAGAPYVAFFPLRIQTKIENARFHNELNMAGNFAADYTGILCAPGAEHQAVPAFARYLKQMNWARMNLDNIRVSEPRLRLLLAHFPKASRSRASACCWRTFRRRISRPVKSAASERSTASTTICVRSRYCRRTGTLILRP